MKITYWSDYACPYCYIGEARLKKAINNIPELKEVEIEMKAFQLDPTAGEHATGDTQTRFAHKYGISFEDAGRQIETISRMGIAEDLDFRYATTLFTNTMDAHRLTKLAQSKSNPELAEKVIETLFKAYFTDNKELADKDLLLQIGVECGLDSEEVKEVLATDKYKDEVILDEREAARYGIHAVPFFVVGQYGISGAQSVEGMKATIMKVMEETAEEPAEQGMTCGLDGCHIG
ncbi:MAG: DsbA family oxidoreductase [Acidaminococcaceae bacterium]|nr:DsbA family oxidoreductase [Acidaminococcaceae bacterium]MBR1590249.1 DsbA family oxidoreductase [Acidaminococcaceae bacterium]